MCKKKMDNEKTVTFEPIDQSEVESVYSGSSAAADSSTDDDGSTVDVGAPDDVDTVRNIVNDTELTTAPPLTTTTSLRDNITSSSSSAFSSSSTRSTARKNRYSRRNHPYTSKNTTADMTTGDCDVSKPRVHNTATDVSAAAVKKRKRLNKFTKINNLLGYLSYPLNAYTAYIMLSQCNMPTALTLMVLGNLPMTDTLSAMFQ